MENNKSNLYIFFLAFFGLVGIMLLAAYFKSGKQGSNSKSLYHSVSQNEE